MSERKSLPHRRLAETFDLAHGNQRAAFQVTVGYFPDTGNPAEVFVANGAKAGSALDTVNRDCAILLSLCFQHGVPLQTLKSAITREQSGIASSVIGAVIDILAKGKS